MTDLDGGTCYRAAPGWETPLQKEITLRWSDAHELSPGLWWLPGPARPMAWALQTWFDVRAVSIESIGHAARILREHGAWWGYVPTGSVRRGALVQEKLPQLRKRSYAIPGNDILRSLGAYTLPDRDTLLFAAQTDRPFSGGLCPLEEDREGPPGRAYRKLWEALLLLGVQPSSGEVVREWGAAPGAWTWTLAHCGATVHSIDKAPLDPRVKALPGVVHEIGSAFADAPGQMNCDWFCSDIICYPERLLKHCRRWVAESSCQRYVVTIKFQGDIDFDVLRQFQELPGRVVHLSQNKTECTWLNIPNLSATGPWPWTEVASTKSANPG